MAIYGYHRTSTKGQNIKLGISIINEYCNKNNLILTKIYTDQQTGVKFNRLGLEQLKEVLVKDDVLIVESISRLGRSLIGTLQLIEELSEKGVILKSTKEDIDMTTAMGRFMVNMACVQAELERDLIVERTNTALKVSRARGRVGGRPKIDKSTIKVALSLYDSKEYSIKEICARCKISQGTLYNTIRERKISS